MKINVLMTAIMLMTSVTAYSADDKPKPVTAPGSKIYLIYLESATQGRSYVLEAVEPVEFKGVKCLKGRHADITWVKDRICYIPVDKISTIVEYDSLEQYKQDIQKFREAQLK